MLILLKNRKPIEVDYDRQQLPFEVDYDRQQLPLLRRMLNAAPFRLRWDYNGWRKTSTAASPYTQKEWNQTLTTKINEISAQIHKSTLRGGADSIVVSSEILSILEDIEYFKDNDGSFSFGSRYEIHVNKYLPANHMIICKMVSDEEEWFKNNRLMGLIMVDGIADAEAELSAILSEQIAGRIDREILSGLRKTKINMKYLLISK